MVPLWNLEAEEASVTVNAVVHKQKSVDPEHEIERINATLTRH